MDMSIEPFTPTDVCLALGLSDYDDCAVGEMCVADIAKNMLDGYIKFEAGELNQLAEFKGVSVNELLQYEQFSLYQNIMWVLD